MRGWNGEGVDKNSNSRTHNIYKDLSEVNSNNYDTILLMDVLEHVEEDREFLSTALSKLKPDGYCIITVPAFQFLFSEHDLFLDHYRRYELHNLVKLTPCNGYSIQKVHYFFFTLFLLRLVQFFMKNKSKVTNWSHPEESLLTKIITNILNFDYKVCRVLSILNIKIPGLSCIMILKRTT